MAVDHMKITKKSDLGGFGGDQNPWQLLFILFHSEAFSLSILWLIDRRADLQERLLMGVCEEATNWGSILG